MANPFLTDGHEEIETAILLEKAYVTDIGNAVAYTDGTRVFINTEDNLDHILPAYNNGMLKWLLWHERMHMDLKHHNRFFKYLEELSESETEEKFQVTKQEVNIIMDILVHDWMSSKFPELVDIAIANLAQMRNRNSLGYTFKTFTLEEMLEEYRKHKKGKDDEGDGKADGKESKEGETGEPASSKSTDSTPGESEAESGKGETETSEDETKTGKPVKKSKPKKSETDETPTPKESERPEDSGSEKDSSESEHDKTDWRLLDNIDDKEFIDEDEADKYIDHINRLKRKKFKLGKLTHQLNALTTTARERTYRLPSIYQPADGCIFKGKTQGKTALYLIFDASGSMMNEMEMFKEIISKSVPQAMKCPCEWSSGYYSKYAKATNYAKNFYGRYYNDFYKGTFEDFMHIDAGGGYDDDGDRAIELCYLAEQKGYSPIGVTDGGWTGSEGYYIRHEEVREMAKALKRTVIVSQEKEFIEELKKFNPRIQTIYVG